MKLKLFAISLLVAIAGWLFIPIPYKTVASQTKIETKEVTHTDALTSTQTLPEVPQSRGTKTAKKAAQVSLDASQENLRHYSKEEVQQLIRDYANQYNINPEVPLCIARWESGYNQFSKNKSSTASGVFQYIRSTWVGTDEGRAGLSVFDADANIRAAIKYMASRRNTIPWVVHNRCPHL